MEERKNTQPQKRNGAIDFWKFVFSLVIVSFHTFHYRSINGMQPFISGNSSVEFFFLVSGFLMAQSAYRNNAAFSDKGSLGEATFHFMKRKIKGLYPEFTVAWIFAFIVMHLAKKSFTLTSMAKDFLTGIWELCLLRMSGLAGYRANVVTWYISAMILAMLILYPLLFKYKDTFLFILAPALSIFLLGYMYQVFGSLNGGTTWQHFYYRGYMRALADLCLGCILWKICQAIKRYQYTELARILFSAVELSGYMFCLFWMFGKHSSEMTFVILMIFAVCIPITFSHKAITASLFDNRLCYFLGKASFSLYIGHIFWIKSLDAFFPSYTFKQQLLILAVLLAITVAAIMGLSDLIRKNMPSAVSLFKGLLIKE